ncbi:MAG: DUF1822 family protein [Thiomargarita sp.]|nr:DUF1822 family protein [Thiomargarita sp.]
MSYQNTQDWLNLLGGQSIPNADPNTVRDAQIFRAALLAHADKDEAEIPYPHILNNVLSCLKKNQPKLPKSVSQHKSPTPFIKIPQVNLNQWLQGNLLESMKAGWLTLEEIFPTPAIAFRSATLEAKTIKRAKQIHLGKENTVVLVIELEEQDNQEIRVLMRLSPTETQTHLPENLKFKVIPESGEPLEEIAGTHHDYIEQDWFYEKGECFRVVVELNGISVTENFEFPNDI